VLVVKLETGARGFRGDQGIHDDQAAIPFDDVHVGQVEAAHLVQPLGHLEQAGDIVQLCLPPQAGIDSTPNAARSRSGADASL